MRALADATLAVIPDRSTAAVGRLTGLAYTLTHQVLVGTGGKAARIRVLEGLGMGLDERAVETVRGWRFSPGRDANKRPVTARVTIETHFQEFGGTTSITTEAD